MTATTQPRGVRAWRVTVIALLLILLAGTNALLIDADRAAEAGTAPEARTDPAVVRALLADAATRIGEPGSAAYFTEASTGHNPVPELEAVTRGGVLAVTATGFELALLDVTDRFSVVVLGEDLESVELSVDCVDEAALADVTAHDVAPAWRTSFSVHLHDAGGCVLTIATGSATVTEVEVTGYGSDPLDDAEWRSGWTS